MFEFLPTVIDSSSPLITAPNHTDESSPRVTSPAITAFSAIKHAFSVSGVFELKVLIIFYTDRS